MLVLTVLSSSISLVVGNAAATADSDAEADDIRPTVRITSPEKSPQKIVTISGPASGVTLNLDGTAFDGESSVDIVEVKVNDAATLQLLRGYETAIATGPAGEHDFSTWAKKITFDEEGTYRVCARATDEAGNLNWWHVLVNVEIDNEVVNGKIAFSSYRSAVSGVYLMNGDGSDETNLSNAQDGQPNWSPDGTKIAFVSTRDGNNQVYVMNADGTGQTNLSNNGFEDLYPSWSPDGTKIAFVSTRTASINYEIYVMNADGTGQTNLSNSPASENGPKWSPDGTKIAFDTNRDGLDNVEVYVMNADGTGQTNLSNTGLYVYDYAADWSPDGTKISFASSRDDPKYFFEIYVMDADGSNQTRLTTSIGFDGEPSWSPDGTKIAFDSFRDENFEVYVMNADGTGQTNLSNRGSSEYTGDWGVQSIYAN